MNLTACRCLFMFRREVVAKTWLFMKIILLLLFAICLNANAKGYSQKLRLSEKNASIEKVFKEISKQTGYKFVYTASLLNKAKKVTIHITNATLEEVLTACFKDQLLTFSILNDLRLIIIKDRERAADKVQVSNSLQAPPVIDITG